MTSRFSSLSDSEIDAIASKRSARWVCLMLAFMALFIVSACFSVLGHDEMILAAARTIGLPSSLALLILVGIQLSHPDELNRLEEDPGMLERALDILKRSPSARLLRDEILASGRALRIFDFFRSD